MNVKNCRKCRRLFNYVTGPFICPSCREALEEEFQKVKKYVEENKNQGIREVAEACEVEIQQIKDWVREERLQFSEDSAIGLNCERCGAVIRSGRYCDKCKAEMTNTFNHAIGKDRRPEPADNQPSRRDASAKMSVYK